MKKHQKIGLLSFLLLSACAGKPTFQPEVPDESGVISSQGGVLYSIPAQNPVLKMKLVSMVIPQKTNAQVRMYFVRKSALNGAYLDPNEQSISLPDSESGIKPSRVHADVAGKPLIRLADTPKQAIELEFPLPPGGRHQYPFIQLNWKVHYRQNGKDQVMEQSERFDFVHKVSPLQGVGQTQGENELEFPYADYSSPLPAEWMSPGWIWW